ncbi:MAG: hypothetical protein V1839_02305 [archaeon]
MRRFDDYRKVQEYLQAECIPFPCPYLRALPEDVTIIEGKTFLYKKGDLLCNQTPGSLGTICSDHRCHVTGPIIKNEKGKLEIACGWSNHKLEITVTNFELKKDK